MSINTPAPAGQHRTDPRPPDTGPGAARDYARRLREDGGTYRGIAAAAGLAPATVHDLVSGRRPGTPYTATALRAVTSQALPRARLDAGGTRLRLRALHVMGHGSARIARAAGVREMTIRALVRGDARTISPQLRDTITALYDAWWDKRAPERTRAERGAATLARRRAIAGNWCAAAALDDDQLDIPGYRPRHGWKPATGTGTAPGIRPSGHHHQEEGRVAADDRMNLDFILQFLDVLERHGYHYHDDQHTGRAIGLLGDLARIYEGTQDHPCGPSSSQAPSRQPRRPETDRPGREADQDAVILSATEVRIIPAALDEAADYKRDRAAACADCADQSCGTCQWRLRGAETYGHLATQMLWAAEATRAAAGRQPAPGTAYPTRSQPQTAAEREAGQ